MRRLVSVVLAVAGALLVSSCGLFAEPIVPSVDELSSTDHFSQTLNTSGTYVADSGFRPEPDGFSFPNYGDDADTGPVANLGANGLVEIFGEDVCLVGAGNSCRLSSAATTWLQVVNNATEGGHCEGMAVMSQLFFNGDLDPADYGAPTTYALPFEGNVALQSEIARWFAVQITEPTASAELAPTPNDVLDLLIKTLPQPRTPENTYTLGIFKPDMSDGHAITPFAVEDRGEGIFWILVYDNNYPGETRAIAVERDRNIWSYLAATRPDLEGSVYIGTDETGSLGLTPIGPRLEAQKCPFCAGELDAEVASGGTNQFSLTGDGSLALETDFYIADAAGQRLGRAGGQLVEEIDEGQLVPLMTGVGDAAAPFINAPAALDTEVTIASALPETDLDFAMIGAGYDVLIDGINSPAGSQTKVSLKSDGSGLTYQQGPRNGPMISVAVADEDEYNFDLEVDLVEFDTDNARFRITSQEEADDLVLGSPNAAGAYAVTANVVGPDGSERTVNIPEVTLQAGEALVLELPGDGQLVATVVSDDGEPLREVPVA